MGAAPAKRASFTTTLMVAGFKIEVGLFGTHASPSKLAEFETAGPNGGALKAELRGHEKPIEEQIADVPDRPVMDPLAADPGSDAPPAENGGRAPAEAVMVPGEFTRVLVEEGSGEVVEPDQVKRGVRLDDGRFVDCTAQLEAIAQRTKLDRMDVVSFIDVGQIQRERVKGSYYVGATDEQAPLALRWLYEALKSERRAAVVKATKRSRQTLGVIVAHAPTKTLVLLELVWAEDFAAPPARALLPSKAAVTERQVEMMRTLVREMRDTRESLDELRDDAVALREELRAAALTGAPAEVIEPMAPVAPEEDYEALLAASVAAVTGEE